MTKVLNKNQHLLGAFDPSVFELIESDISADILLVCEHAGQAVPIKLNGLGVSLEIFNQHIGYDIGAAKLTRKIAAQLNVPAILQNYSRLVIDCNRPTNQSDSIPEMSDHTLISGNLNISDEDRQSRIDEIFTPFHDKISQLLDQNHYKLIIAIHSFTPQMNGNKRPWDVGFLFRQDQKTSRSFMQYLSANHPDLNIGENQPYNIENNSDWFVPIHGEQRRIAHSLIEVRNDHLLNESGINKWAEIISKAIQHFLSEPLNELNP